MNTVGTTTSNGYSYAPAIAAALVLAAAVIGLAVLFGGPWSIAYLLIYGASLIPGLPLGFALFGRRHAAGWIGGALCGYALTSIALWVPVEFGATGALGAVAAWASVTALTWYGLRTSDSLVTLPTWTRRETLALLLVLAVVPLLVGRPFAQIGERDGQDNLRYRAYFTADFLWHVALTSELSKADDDPRNPYLARRPLRYYWAYFVLPATVVRTAPVLPSIESTLEVNALCAGLLFVSALYVFAWSAVPRAFSAATAVVLAILAASAEGVYAAVRHQPIERLRHLNIDAITSWFHQGLTVDGLPRSLWYTPQHAAACALGVVALLVATHGGPRIRAKAVVLAGISLGLALTFSPFLGGSFSLIYGLTAAWAAWRTRDRAMRTLAVHALAAGPVLVALGWCLINRTFEGAGGNVAIGLSRRAMAAPFLAPALTLGPVLALAAGAVAFRREARFRLAASTVALVVGLFMFYAVTLTAEPIWIGWRAGQIILVTIPALIAATLGGLCDRGHRRLATMLATVVLAIGLPTTLIDLHNAQDTGNLEMGPGFRWTVVVPPDSQAALTWIREQTPETAVVQMSITPRGRETWTLLPSLAERRMAAGQPISLLKIPEYTTDSARADAMFSSADPAEAWRIARAMDIDYVYVDGVERQAFGKTLDKFEDRNYFETVFQQGDAAVYQVR